MAAFKGLCLLPDAYSSPFAYANAAVNWTTEEDVGSCILVRWVYSCISTGMRW